MTMPDPDRPRKPPRRFWLFAPYGVLLAAIAVWSGMWLAERAGIERALDAGAARLRAQGWSVGWSGRHIDGYPFRLDVTLDQPHIAEPSGWGLAAPRLKAQAYAYRLDNWIVVADEGVTLARPHGGTVAIAGRALRASLAGFDQAPPRLAIEGVDLTFTPRPGGAPFPITAAGRLGLFARPVGDGAVEGYLRLAAAAAPPGGWLGRLAAGRPFALISDVFASKTDAFAGPDWPSAARRWARAGGTLSVARAGLAAGPLRLGVGGGALSVDAEGALKGALTLDLGQTPGAMRRLFGGDGDPLALEAATSMIEARTRSNRSTLVDLTFQAGATTLGPIALGPAPRIY